MPIWQAMLHWTCFNNSKRKINNNEVKLQHHKSRKTGTS